ncbi:uncharacterized protein LOC114574989 [Exaiptasia diaphana]|uniref:Uncharacterized protein n=1 Tax=Exaiptasia diaphana TaxID=2652724 RepID=A0A913YI43_EXADI|nr:uncharacterized protein LOC114574989 [Exaiptasia diaphana]KXJ14719.1 hypothetical protein AC249_AIPGENE5004 [Exaiptasia diaphana]
MMMTASSYRTEWEELSSKGIVTVTDPDKYITISVNPTNQVDLRTIFKLLQSILYFSHGKVRCVVPIGGAPRTFYLSRATRGESQILVESNNGEWDQQLNLNARRYNDVINYLSTFDDQNLLADIMIRALTSPLNNQPNFEHTLIDQTMIRRVVEFLVITMVAEAATPTDLVKKAFIEQLARSRAVLKKHFPEWNTMPKFYKIRKDIRGSGRSPTMDDVALVLLYKMRDDDFDDMEKAFSVVEFPARDDGGTAKARKYVYDNGERNIPSFWITKKADEIVEAATCTELIPMNNCPIVSKGD